MPAVFKDKEPPLETLPVLNSEIMAKTKDLPERDTTFLILEDAWVRDILHGNVNAPSVATSEQCMAQFEHFRNYKRHCVFEVDLHRSHNKRSKKVFRCVQMAAGPVDVAGGSQRNLLSAFVVACQKPHCE